MSYRITNKGEVNMFDPCNECESKNVGCENPKCTDCKLAKLEKEAYDLKVLIETLEPRQKVGEIWKECRVNEKKPMLKITFRNLRDVRIVRTYGSEKEFMMEFMDDDKCMSWDDIVLLVQYDGMILYSSIGKKRDLIVEDLYKWFSNTGRAKVVEEEWERHILERE